jgi:hypothetical protein
VARGEITESVIHRRGSFLYTAAYRKHVVALTVAYALLGALLAAAAAARFESLLIAALVFTFVVGLCVSLWAVYLCLLWFFKREAEQSVEINEAGVRETFRGREVAFLPWAGVKQIEVAATIVAGASLRIKGNFSEISISNVDLAITRPMSISEMHAALARTDRLRAALASLRAGAPGARVLMNRLARRRARYALDESF